MLVSKSLIGNYTTWSKSMRIALNAKYKLGFVNRLIKKPYGMLVITGADHHSVQIFHSQHIFRVFELFNIDAKSLLTISCRFFPV